MPWKTYPDCSDYEVSDAGEVRRVRRVLPRGRPTPYLLGQRLSNSGYLHVSLSIDEVPRNVFVHRMVLRTFRGEPPTLEHQGAHLDGNRTNNALRNLVWATRCENEAHKHAHGTSGTSRGLTESQVLEMRRLYRETDTSARKLGAQFCVSAPTAHGVVTGRYWPHLPGATLGKSKGRKKLNVSSRHSDDYR